MKKWQKIIGLILIGLASILLTWRLIADYERYDITGSWNLDFNNTYLHSDSASLEFLNGWIIIHNDSIDLPPIYVPHNKIQHTLDLSKGTWSVDKKNNSITINAPNHPFHGKYFMKELREICLQDHRALRRQNHRLPEPHYGRRHRYVRRLPGHSGRRGEVCLRGRPRL